MAETIAQATPTQSGIKIPQQLIDAGAKFVKVKWHSKAAFEVGWERHTYSHDDVSLVDWLSKNGNYGVVSHGIGTIDIDDMEVFKSLGLEVPDSYTDCREGCRYHVYFKCNILPESRKASKFIPKTFNKNADWGDIRFAGHDSYVVGTGCCAPNKINEIHEYKPFNNSPVKYIEWSVFQNIIEKSMPQEAKITDNGTLEIVEAKPNTPPLKMADEMHHQDLRRYVGNQVRLNVPLVAIRAACSAMNKKALFDRIRGDVELSAEVDGAWDWHVRAKTKRDADKADQENQTSEQKMSSAKPDVTEVKISEWFVRFLNGNYVFNVTTGKWHVWNGICWAVDESKTINKQAHDFVKTLFTERNGFTIEEVLKNQKELIKMNTKTGISNIISLASSQLVKLDTDFDKDIHLLNLQNGTLVFDENGYHFKDHAKEDMISLVGGCAYDPKVEVPELWLKHINTITGGDDEMGGNIQEIFGYCLDGGNPNEHFLMLHGGGRNGKSVTLRVFMNILGNYGLYVNPLTLMENGNALYSPERLLMASKRMIVAQEPNKPIDTDVSHRKDATSIDASFIKAASGGDVIPARKIHSNDVKNIRVSGVITFCTNPLPRVTDDSVAFWERIITVPFKYVIPGWQRDPTVEGKLKAVSSGILNWLLVGYLRQKGVRFKPCPDIKEDIAEYRFSVDEYAGFRHACIEDDENGVVVPADLYKVYEEWSKAHGIVPKSNNVFFETMKKQYNWKRTNTGTTYRQIKIKTAQTTI